MMKSHKVFAASAVFLSAALAAGYYLHTKHVSIKPNQVLTWDCESPAYKPETIMLTCADGGWLVDKIKWSTWGEKGAAGSGYFSENLCEPSCAEGKRVEEKVTLKLSKLTPYKGKYYLRALDINTVSGNDFWWGRSDGLEWDVMEFAANKDWVRVKT